MRQGLAIGLAEGAASLDPSALAPSRIVPFELGPPAAALDSPPDRLADAAAVDLVLAAPADEGAWRATLQHLQALGLPAVVAVALPADPAAAAAALGRFAAGCAELGLVVGWRRVEGAVACHLVGPIAAGLAAIGPAAPAAGALRAAGRGGRPTLLVAGFFGRGNCGDEALLQVIYEEFAADFDVVISLDEHGASPGYWNWYPYDRCRRIHQGNLADPARLASAMLVGGGGLPLGFVAGQVVAARAAGIPIVLAGTDFPASRAHAGARADRAVQDYVGNFDVVALRSRQAVDQAAALGIAALHGADWGLRLATDRQPGLALDGARALLVLREFPLGAVPFRYVAEIERLVAALRRSGLVPTLLPFCEEDDRFAGALGLDLGLPVERHWWNARRVKQLIAMSGLLISVGRLHPTIFAASSRTPVAQLRPPLSAERDEGSFAKIRALAAELDIDFHDSVDSLCERLAQRGLRPSGEAALAAAERRLAAMIATLRERLGAAGG